MHRVHVSKEHVMIKQLNILLLSSFIAVTSQNVLASETAEDVLTEAREMYKKADSLQGAWISTGKIIKQTEKALQTNKKSIALKLAKKARKEARLSYEQATEQLQNWSEPSYIRK